jgi:hypothetical protein
MKNPVIFASTCPVCGQERLQHAYTRRALTRLIESSQIIDAYCVACDVVWPVSAHERVVIADGTKRYASDASQQARAEDRAAMR